MLNALKVYQKFDLDFTLNSLNKITMEPSNTQSISSNGNKNKSKIQVTVGGSSEEKIWAWNGNGDKERSGPQGVEVTVSIGKAIANETERHLKEVYSNNNVKDD